jgi:hypothetical protein
MHLGDCVQKLVRGRIGLQRQPDYEGLEMPELKRSGYGRTRSDDELPWASLSGRSRSIFNAGAATVLVRAKALYMSNEGPRLQNVR